MLRRYAEKRESGYPSATVGDAIDSEAPGPDLSGAQLAEARGLAGLTQRELADRLGVRLWIVDQWESGARPIPHEQLDRIAAAVETLAVPGAPEALASAAVRGEIPRGLTAQEIRDAQLPRSLRGYDEAATRRLLGELADAYERVLVERDELRKRVDELAAGEEEEKLRRRVEELEQALAGHEESEQVVSRALVAASRAGEELRQEAEAEAQGILDEARRSAEETRREVDDRRSSFETERAAIVEELKREALASARDDLVALEHAAEPAIRALAVLEEHIRAIVPQAGAADGPELLDDLKAPPPEPVVAADGD